MIITTAALYAHIAANPGNDISEIADALGTRYQDIYSKLTTLEKPGYLVYESNGRLYPMEEKEIA